MLPNETTTRSEIVALPGELEALVAAPGREEGRDLVALLKREKLNVTLVGDTDSAFEEALLHRPNLLLIHQEVPAVGGVELIQRLKGNTRTHFLPAVLFTPKADRRLRLRALSAGADAIFASGGPESDQQEQRTRLWALLRSQSLFRRQEDRRQAQGVALKDRGRWIGSFVHDLQNAVGALQANFEFLGQTAIPQAGERNQDLRDCVRETRQLLQQLGRGLRTVQDYERFSSGRVLPRSGPLELQALLLEVEEELGWTVDRAGHPLHLLLPGTQVWVEGDRDLLRQAFTALAAHLLRQPRTSKVEVRARLVGGEARLELRGDGASFAGDDPQRLFEPYARVPRRGGLGQGLALALARAIIELSGGQVSAAVGPIFPSFEVVLKSSEPSPNQPLAR